MARVKGSFSGRQGIEMWGLDEIVQKLNRVEANLNSALTQALQKSSEPVTNYMLDFLKLHLKGMPIPTFQGKQTQVTLPRGVGNTAKAMYTKTRWTGKGTVLRLEVGFDKDNGGLPALFLDLGTKKKVYGTPLIKPTYFVYYAINNNLNEIHRIQVETLNNIFRELTGTV